MKNIILITIDCLRYDYSHDLIKDINKVLGEGIEFERAYATGPATPFSFLGILCSKYPIAIDENICIKANEKGQWMEYYSPKKCFRLSIHQVLKKHRYAIFTLFNNPYVVGSGSLGSIDYVLDEGQQKIIVEIKKRSLVLYKICEVLWFNTKKFLSNFMDPKSTSVPYLDAKQIYEKIKTHKELSQKNPIFLHLHFMDLHGPFEYQRDKHGPEINKTDIVNLNIAIKRYMSRLVRTTDEIDFDLWKKIYKKEISYTSIYLIKTLQYLKNSGILDNSLIVLTSDHGQLFNEHKLIDHAHQLRSSGDLESLLCEELLHVPLVLYGLGAGRNRQEVSLIDIPPTVVTLVNLAVPPCWYGQSLLSNKKRPAISEVVALDDKLYSIRISNTVFVYNETKQLIYPDSANLRFLRVIAAHKKRKTKIFGSIFKQKIMEKIIRLRNEKPSNTI